MSDPAVRQHLDVGFAKLKESGVHVARWWVFEGNAWQITRDGKGAPTGVDPRVFADIDAALALAEKHDLYYEFTLFHGPGNVPAAWLTDSTQRGKLVQVLTTLFSRYSGHPRILAYDVMNEPEWDIWNKKIAKEPVQALVREVATAVHASSTARVTVGSAMLDGLPMWVGLGLDYYEAHWYDYMSSGDWCARCTDYATVKQRYNLDRPLVIGEFYAGPDVDAVQRLQDWRAKGYAGAFAWSLLYDRTHDKMQIDLAAMKQFTDLHTDIGPSAVSASPTATPTIAPSPTATLAPTSTATSTPAASPTLAPTHTRTPEPSATATPTATSALVATATETPRASATATLQATATTQPTATATVMATATKPGNRKGQR